MEEKYFAASNSKRGFVSYYSDAFGDAERVYIIKGGPGTGKSYFMRQVAKAAEGAGYHVVYIYCSSDPESLDGIVIDRKIALIDGTAPHAVEASVPVARDELLDLAAFLNRAALESKVDKIKHLSEKKSLCYARAYDALAAAGKLSDAAEKLVLPFVLKDKLCAAAARYVKLLPANGDGREYSLAQGSVGMRGCVRFSTLEERAKSKLFVRDKYGVAHIFLDAVIKEAKERGVSLRVSRDPISPESADAVELGGGLLFTMAECDSVKTVNTERFVDKDGIGEIKKEYKLLMAAKNEATECAKLALSDAAKQHFELERIYTAAIDLDAKEKFTKEFISSLILALK